MTIRRFAALVPAAGVVAIALGAGLAPGAQAIPDGAVFGQCIVCHSIDGSNGTGPTLKGVFGRKSGSVPGFRYGRALRAAGIVWDDVSLDQFLKSPQGLVPGTLMPFSGVPESAQRAALIAYLKSLR